MPESVTPLIAVGVVIVLFIVLLSVLTSNYSLNGIKSKTVGDGQHGTARWATTQEVKKTFANVPFDVASWRAGKNLPEVQGLILGSTQRGKQLDALVDCQFQLEKPLCLVCDDAELLEAALGHEYEIVDGVERWTKNDEFTRHSSSFVTIGTHLYYFDKTGTIARNTDVGTMHFDEYGRYTSGMPELDELVQQVIAENTDDSMTQEEKLKVLYDYTVNSFSYLRRNYYAIGETGWQNQEAYTMLSTDMGNCYCYAATFGELARAIGYDAQAYSGTVGSNRAKHSWVEIEIDGVNYTFDSELEMAGRKKYVYRDMYMMTPEQARIWNYKR